MGILLIRQPGGCGDAIEEALLHHKYRVQALEHGEDAGAHLSYLSGKAFTKQEQFYPL